MGEPTPEACDLRSDIAERLGGLHFSHVKWLDETLTAAIRAAEQCGRDQSLTKSAEKLAEAAKAIAHDKDKIAEQVAAARLAGWEECREACLYEYDKETACGDANVRRTAPEVRLAIAALTPPAAKEETC